MNSVLSMSLFFVNAVSEDKDQISSICFFGCTCTEKLVCKGQFLLLRGGKYSKLVRLRFYRKQMEEHYWLKMCNLK